MDFIKKNGKGLLFCLALAVPSAVLGKLFPVVGGPVFAILIGMILALVISYILHRTMNIPEKISTLVGVGS